MTFIDWAQHFVHRIGDVLQLTWFRVGHVDVSLALLIGLILILLIPWYVARGAELMILSAGRQRLTIRQSTIYALARITRYFVLAIGVLFGLTIVGLDLTSFALFGGAIGLGIGLGLQNVFSNFVSGVILLTEQTLNPGDFVELESGIRGTVVEIGMRYTLIRTNSAVDIIVPNSEFTAGRVTSWTHGSRYRRLTIPFSVAYGSDKEKVRAAALSAARAVKTTVEDETRRPDVWFTRFGDSALEFALLVWIGPDAITRPGATTSKYLWALDDALRASGIEIPFPQRDLHIRSGQGTPGERGHSSRWPTQV